MNTRRLKDLARLYSGSDSRLGEKAAKIWARRGAILAASLLMVAAPAANSAAQTDPSSDDAGAAAAAAAAAAMAGSGAWAASIDAKDWVQFNTEDDTVDFYRPSVQKTPDGHRRIWIRFEYANEQQGDPAYKGLVTLEEVDCAKRHMRDVQSTSYAENNMQQAVATNSTVTPWTSVTPGTIGQGIVNIACEK